MEPSAEEFAQYIKAYTGGIIGADATLKVELTEDVAQQLASAVASGAALPDGLFTFKPSIEGTMAWDGTQAVVFTPAAGALVPGEKYSAKFALAEIFRLRPSDSAQNDKVKDFQYGFAVSTSATLTGLKPGTTYTYVIRAQWGSRYTDYSTVTASTLRGDVTIAFEKLNQLGGTGNSGKVKATYGCGGTSVTMLLNEKGMNLNKDDVLKKQYTNGWCAAGCPIPFPYGASSWGSVMSNLADLVRSYGFTPHINTAPEMIDIKRLLNDNKLLLVGLRTASGAHHFQIIYGYYISGGVVYYRVHDPYGNYCVAWAESYLRSRIYAVDTTDYLCRQVRGIMWL